MKQLPVKRIIPVNEPNGEGNGWDACSETFATGFEVTNESGELIAHCDTRADAERFLIV